MFEQGNNDQSVDLRCTLIRRQYCDGERDDEWYKISIGMYWDKWEISIKHKPFGAKWCNSQQIELSEQTFETFWEALHAVNNALTEQGVGCRLALTAGQRSPSRLVAIAV